MVLRRFRFARMGTRWMGAISRESRTQSGQCCPHQTVDRTGSQPAGPTPGSSMNSTGFPAASRRAFWIVLVSLSFLSSGAGLHAQSANTLYKQGHAAEQREDFDAAYQDYQKAYAKDPKDMRFRTAMYRVRGTAAAQHL